LKSSEFKYSSTAILALVVPIIFDIIADLFFNLKEEKRSDDYTMIQEGTLNDSGKLLFLSGIIVLPIVAFLPENTTNWAKIYLCRSKCQQI
jgi:uncharacterized membrane protein SirB2